MDCLLYHNMLHTLELNYGMLGSHMNMFIWQGIILLFFIIFPLMVKFLLAVCKERCDDGACWYRSVEAAHGPLLEELVEEGPLEARTALCGTDSLLSGPVQYVPPVLGVRRPWAQGCACAAWGCCTPKCCPGQVRFRGVSHWITPLLCPFTHCPCRGEGWVPADVSTPKPSWELWNESRREECCQRSHFSPLTPISQAAFTLCVGLWVCLGFLTTQLSALHCLQTSLIPHPWPSSSLSLGNSGGRGTPGTVISGWDSVLGKSFQEVCWLLSHVSRKGQVWLLARTWTGR